jgi:hypothetical protein
MSLIRLGVFVVFAALCIGAAAMADRPRGRLLRWLVTTYFLVASAAAGLAQRDLWPFSGYPVIAESSSRWREAVWYSMFTIESGGGESPLAADAIAPLRRSVLEKWIERTFVHLPEQQKRRAASWIVARANQPATWTNVSPLGPLSAPDWLVRPGPARATARGMVVGIRVYEYRVGGRSMVYEYKP